MRTARLRIQPKAQRCGHTPRINPKPWVLNPRSKNLTFTSHHFTSHHIQNYDLTSKYACSLMFSCKSMHEKTKTSAPAEFYTTSTRSSLKPYRNLHHFTYETTMRLENSALFDHRYTYHHSPETKVQICLNPVGSHMKDAIFESQRDSHLR